MRDRSSDIAVLEGEPQYKPAIRNGYWPDDIVTKGLVFYAPLYRYKGLTFRSVDPYKHLCTVTGALWIPQGRLFDAIDDKIIIPHATSIDIGGVGSSYTFMVWAQGTVNSSNPFVDKEYYPTTPLYMVWDGNGYTANIRKDYPTYAYAVLISGVLMNQWHLVTVTKTPTQLSISINDGIPVTTNIANVDYRSNVAIHMGQRTDGWSSFPGIIGAGFLYTIALTALEVQHNYRVTRWRYGV